MVGVPEVWREALEHGVVVTTSGDGTKVEIWPTLEFDRHVTAAAESPDLDERQAVMLRRFFAARAVDTMLDDHGRLEIEAFILDGVGLAATDAVRMVGAGTHVECHGFRGVPETPRPGTRR